MKRPDGGKNSDAHGGRRRKHDARNARGKRAHRLGRWAEFLCVARLVLSGWRILDRGAKLARGSGVGEIDIVARRGNLIAVIEVKARPTLDEAAAAISTRQRDRLIRAAAAYIARRPALARCTLRFDAMLVAPGTLPRRIKDAWRIAG